jgi:peptide/nickel transport system substrate-binding protein
VRRITVFTIAAAMLVSLAGCFPTGDGGNTEAKDTLTFGIYADITSLDKQAKTGRPARFILNNTYETLVTRDADGKLIPHILKDWTYDDATMTWHFTARDDIDFSNGEHLTAEDIAASMERIGDPATDASLGNWWKIKEVKVTGDYTLDIVCSEPNPLAIIRGDDTAILPKSWVDKVGHVPYTGTDIPPGMGAYILTEWKPDDEIVFKANPNYFLGKPPIENLIFRVIPDPAARVAALLAGDVDVIYPLAPDQRSTLDNNPAFRVDSVASTARARVVIDNRFPPFDDIRVREAVSLAIDRQTIIDNLLPGAVAIPAGLIPEEVGFDPNLALPQYDPEKAKALLAEAGYPDGIGPFEFSVDIEQERGGGEVQAIADQLNAVGIKVHVQEYDPGDFDTKNLEMLEKPDTLGPLSYDGHSGGQTFHGSFFLTDIQSCETDRDPEFYYYCNTEVHDDVAKANETAASDTAGSTALYQKAEDLLAADYWAAGLWQVPDLYAMNANLKWDPDASGQTSGRLASWGD